MRQSGSTIPSISLLLIICASVAPFAFGQRVSEEHRIGFSPPVRHMFDGQWQLDRVDEDARLSGHDGRVRHGAIRVRPKERPDGKVGPDDALNANKLLRAGVLETPDGTGLALGAEWGYGEAIRTAIRALTEREQDAELPLDPERPGTWSSRDQELYDLGRDALKYLRAARATEANIDTVVFEALEHVVLARVLDEAPQALPVPPEGWRAENPDVPFIPADAKLKSLVKAAWYLGPQAIHTLDLLFDERGTATMEGEAGARERRWYQWLRSEYEVLDRGMARVFDPAQGYAGFSKAAPLTDDPNDWPQGDRVVIRDYNISALRRLELLRATRYDYALKATWAIRHIYRAVAADMLARMVALSKAGELSNDYFDKGFKESAHLDDLVLLLLLSGEAADMAAHLNTKAQIEEVGGVTPEIRARAAHEKTVAKIVTEAVTRLKNEFSKRDAEACIAPCLRMRTEPLSIDTLVSEVRNELLKRRAPGPFCLIELERRRASRLRAKYNWLHDQIRGRDVRAIEKLGMNFDEATTEAILATLEAEGKVTLPNGQVFEGDTENDGRGYDYQKDVERMGLSIELAADLDNPIAINLQPGRSYIFSFSYYTRGLDRQATWIRFIPLDSNGSPMYDVIAGMLKDGDGTPLRVARYAGAEEMTGHRLMGNTADGGSSGWKTAHFAFENVSDRVFGFTIEAKLQNLQGRGMFLYKDFSLKLTEDYFHEDFEPLAYREDGTVQAAATPGSDDPMPPRLWQRVLDPDRGYMAYSKLSYNDLEHGKEGTRSLQIEPNGFNVRLETTRLFKLNSDRSYVFRAKLKPERMESMQTWFEILLFDKDKNPISVDGLRTTPGNNVIRTPYRGDIERSIGWRKLKAADGWIEEEIELDDTSAARLREGYNKAIDTRTRLDIEYAQIAIVVEGPRPAYTARVLVDDIELREYPRVQLTLFQAARVRDANGGFSDEIKDPKHASIMNGTLFNVEEPKDKTPYKLGLELAVYGLANRRSGYHFTIELFDAMGSGGVLVQDTLGEASLSEVLSSDGAGTIGGTRAIRRVFLDDLIASNRLSGRFGYFLARFVLRYLDDPEPLVRRDFHIGFVPPSAMRESDPGDFGVVLDTASDKQRRLYEALSVLNVGMLAVPMFGRDTALDPAAYALQPMVEDLRLFERSLPRIKKVGVLGPLPRALDSLYFESGASVVFSDRVRNEWKNLTGSAQKVWRDTFPDYIIGPVDDQSFVSPSGQPAIAADNIHAVNVGNDQGWAWVEVPLVLAQGEIQQARLTAVTRSYTARWEAALDALSEEAKAQLQSNLNVDERAKLRALRPPHLWLRARERLSFFVPSEVDATAMEASITSYLGRLARFENVLGDDPAVISSNARALLEGGGVDFSALAGNKRLAQEHTLVIDLMDVDPDENVDYARQLSDLTRKLVSARVMGFQRVFVNRLRNEDGYNNGLLTQGNYALPAFHAFRTLIQLVSGKDVMPLDLNLPSRTPHVFFRSRDGREVTVILFPGDKPVIEELPLGNSASRVDLMGNKRPLLALAEEGKSSATTPSGTVAIALDQATGPVIISDINTPLLNTVLSMHLDNPQIEGSEQDQLRKIVVTNHFSSTISVSLSIPFASAQHDTRNIASDLRIKDASGREIRNEEGNYAFDSVELAAGATREFPFYLRPRSSTRVGDRTLNVAVKIKAGEPFDVTQRIPVTIRPLVVVDDISVIEPAGGGVYDVLIRAKSSASTAQAFVATLSFPDMPGARPFSGSFSLPAQGEGTVSLTVPGFSRKRLEGARVVVSLRQSPGSLFFNDDYRFVVDPGNNALNLVKDNEASARK